MDLPWLNLLDTYTNPVQGATAVISQKPDMVFVDMEMPYIDGSYLMDWIEPKLRSMEKKPIIVLITSLEKADIAEMPKVSGYINKYDMNSPDILGERLREILGSS